MKKFLLAFLLLPIISHGQEFRNLNLLPDSVVAKIVVGKRISYTYQAYTFEGVGKIFKVRLNKKMIFADEGEEGQKAIIPHIFMTGDTADLPILMIDYFSDALYGFSLYKLNGLESLKIGFFPIAAIASGAKIDQENIATSSIADKLSLETDGTQIRISFIESQLILRPHTDKEEVVPGDQVKFLYNGKKLKEVEEF
jgi:hypothetical protein